MNTDQIKKLKTVVESAFATLTNEQLQELVHEPYVDFRIEHARVLVAA